MKSFWVKIKEAIVGKPLMSERIKNFIAENPDNAHILIEKVSESKSKGSKFNLELDGKNEELTVV